MGWQVRPASPILTFDTNPYKQLRAQDIEAHRQLRVSKRKLLMKSRSLANMSGMGGSFDSVSEEVSPPETPQKTAKKTER